MEDGLAANNDQIRDELFNAEDEVIISRFLKRMIVNGDSWPEHFIEDVDVFNKNPNVEFESQRPTFVIVKPRTKSCGKTDGCESGCWRIIGRDKLIKSKTGKILGFKKILKFCLKWEPREYKRSWVMEEYRVVDNLINWKQDHVMCKIRLLFQAELSSLLAKHFSYLSTTRSVPIPTDLSLPAYGFYSPDPHEEGSSYMLTIMNYDGNTWPSYVTNDVYRVHPLDLVDPLDHMFQDYGICIFANKTCGTNDKCDGGYWRILHGDRLIKSKSGKTIGFKKVFKFYEPEKLITYGDEDKITWTIEEYRLSQKVKQNKVLCVIKFN